MVSGKEVHTRNNALTDFGIKKIFAREGVTERKVIARYSSKFVFVERAKIAGKIGNFAKEWRNCSLASADATICFKYFFYFFFVAASSQAVFS